MWHSFRSHGFQRSFQGFFASEGDQAAQAQSGEEGFVERRQEKDAQWPADLERLIFCESDLLLKPIVTWGPSEFKESMLPFRPSVCTAFANIQAFFAPF